MSECYHMDGVLVVFSSCSSQHQDLAATGGSRPGDEVRRCEKGADQGQRQGQSQALLSSYQSDGVLIAEITTRFLSDSIWAQQRLKS